MSAAKTALAGLTTITLASIAAIALGHPTAPFWIVCGAIIGAVLTVTP